MRFGWRVKILPGVRVGSRGVRLGPRAVGLRVSRKSASITGGVGPVYYSTYSGRRRRKPARSSGVGCWAVMGILLLIGLGFSLVVVTDGLILIPVALIGCIVLWVRHRDKQDSMAREAERQAREGKQLQGLLSPRLVSLLSSQGITTENQLREVRDEDLLKLPGFGLQSLAEVKGALSEARPGPSARSEALNQPPLLPPASVRGPAASDVESGQLVHGVPPVAGAPSKAALLGVPRSPAEVQELLSRRPPMWEYLLFAGVLAEEKEALEPKWRNHELRYGQRSGPQLSDSDALQFLQSTLNSAKATMSNVDRVLTPSAQEAAFGPRGVAGDPDHIEELGQRVVSIYEGLLDWAASVRAANTSNRLDLLFALAASSVETPILQIRQFIDSVIKEIEEVPGYIANGQPKVTLLELTVKVDNPTYIEFAKELERLGRSAGR